MASDPETPDRGAPLVPPPVARPCSEPPYRGRVLVVAPHPDDESVGVGGLLALHGRLGDPIHALYVTTGVHGDPEHHHDPSKYVALRRREAEAAARVLGIAETEFWDFPDSCVVTSDDLEHVSALLAQLIVRLAPDVIYAPHLGESHSDHYFVGRAVVEARAQVAAAVPLLGYEVWSPLLPDRVVDVTDTYPQKVEAIHCYPSQMAHTDLLGAIEGLNRYRAILLGPGGAEGHRRAEALREVPVNVVHLVHQFPPEFRGGTEVCVETLAAAQQRRGDVPVVVAGSDVRAQVGEVRRETHAGLPVRRVVRRPGENYSMDHSLPRVAEQVVALVDELAPDVVHLHHWLNLSGDLAARLAARGHTVVATLHDFTLVCARFFLVRPDGESCAHAFPLPSDERCVECVLPDFPAGREQLLHETGARRRTGRDEARALELVLVPSRTVAERWRRSGLFADDRVVVVPHAASLASRPPVAPRDRADGRLVLATWGHLAPAKGTLDLLDAVRRVADRRVALLVLGEPVDAGYAERLLDAAEGLDVTFGGAYTAEDLQHYAQGIDLAVFPSRAEETFGLVVSEARALGLPVVVSDRGALPEGVGPAGTSVPAADPAALAGLLTELLADPGRLAAWRGVARAELLDPDAHAATVAALYERARASSRARVETER